MRHGGIDGHPRIGERQRGVRPAGKAPRGTEHPAAQVLLLQPGPARPGHLLELEVGPLLGRARSAHGGVGRHPTPRSHVTQGYVDERTVGPPDAQGVVGGRLEDAQHVAQLGRPSRSPTWRRTDTRPPTSSGPSRSSSDTFLLGDPPVATAGLLAAILGGGGPAARDERGSTA